MIGGTAHRCRIGSRAKKAPGSIMQGKTCRTAFTLLELMAVVIILGIVALVLIPRISASSAAAKESACFQNKAEINAAVERYYFENGSLPNNINDIDNPSYFPDGLPNCPVSGAK